MVFVYSLFESSSSQLKFLGYSRKCMLALGFRFHEVPGELGAAAGFSMQFMN